VLIHYLNGGRMPSRDANSVQIAKMCEAFADNGHEVVLFAREGDAPPATIFDRYGVKPVFEAVILPPLGFRGTRVATFLWRLRRRARRRKPDVFYGRDLLSMLAVVSFGVPVVFEAHNIPERGSLRWKLARQLFAKTNFVRLVAITESLRQMYLRDFPGLGEVDSIVAPSAAGEIATPDGVEPDWPGRAGAFQVGFVGRPFPGKGIETVVGVADKLPEADFHIVGAEASELGWLDRTIPDNVHFHGYRGQLELGRYYARFDAVAAPYGAAVLNASGQESAQVLSSLKVMEYMSSGVPLVASNLPGVREVVENERSALLVPAGDEAAFAAALRRLAEDRDLGRRIARQARAHYLALHTWRARAEAVVSGLRPR
jgi:glycosyltransferase involved in cell wall biosynthesis